MKSDCLKETTNAPPYELVYMSSKNTRQFDPNYVRPLSTLLA